MLCQDVKLPGMKDKLFWKLDGKGFFFSVSSKLRAFNMQQLPYQFKLWRVKLPLEIKIFLWFVHRHSILTKDVLKKRGREAGGEN